MSGKSRLLNGARLQKRQSKKQLLVTFEGKTMNVMVYISKQAKMLPPMMWGEDKGPINHEKMMRTYYTKHGLKGINQYLDVVRDVFKKSETELADALTKEFAKTNAGPRLVREAGQSKDNQSEIKG